MALNRINPQAEDAIELTRRALEYAAEIGREKGLVPEVTVTGHSLGGTLAQITAHHFNLKGETFNAYGAVSLGYRIPAGGDNVINHVMATDVVSAASPHFGQVRVYALPDEIERLVALGDYENTRSSVGDLVRNPGLVAGASLGAHSMHNFTDVDGRGRPDLSVLSGARAQLLADEFDPMIQKYRSDIQHMRSAITIGARGPAGLAHDIVAELRGPLAAGARGSRETQVAEAMAEIRIRNAKPDASWHLYGDSPIAQGQPNALPALPALPGLGGPALKGNSSTPFLDRMLAAAQSGDDVGFRLMTQQLADQEPGRALRNEASRRVDSQERQTALDAQVNQSQQKSEQTIQGHAPRMR